MFEKAPQTDYYPEQTFAQEKPSTSLNDSLRANFMKKVLGIVSVQLLATFSMTLFSISNSSFGNFQRTNSSLLYFSMTVAIISNLALACSSTLARSHPKNLIILGIFTLAESYSVSAYVGLFPEKTVLMALFLTAAVVSSLTLYAVTTKKEVGYFGGLIVLASSSMLMCLIGAFIFGGDAMSSLVSIISAVLAGLYLIYDIQQLMGKDAKRRISLDDYVLGAMIIYMDVIRIFLEILKFLNEMEKDNDKKKRRN